MPGSAEGQLQSKPACVLSVEREARARSIPSLDGLRFVAIALVLLAHCGEGLVKNRIATSVLFELGGTGVSLFFVISGFLITFLLDREKEFAGEISLKNFYIRRTFRIFPPFYVYLAVVMILWAHSLDSHWRALIAAATYTSNYELRPSGEFLASTWSLSLEEQFYLFWPLCVKFLSRFRAQWLAIWLIFLMPVSRALTYYFMPSFHAAGKVSDMFQTRMDTLMFGCLMALCWRSDAFQKGARKFLSPATFWAATFVALLVLPVGLVCFDSLLLRFFSLSLCAIALTIMLVYVVLNPESLAGSFLNRAPVKYLGLISYSLYLYQQLFTGSLLRLFPLNLILSFACAICSYYLVEKPALRLRDVFLMRRRTMS